MLTAPGTGHVVAVGAGTRFGETAVDAAYELTLIRGDGVSPTSGKYRDTGHALHAGVRFSF